MQNVLFVRKFAIDPLLDYCFYRVKETLHIYQKMIFIMLDFPSSYVINWIDCNGHSKRFNETLQKRLHSSSFWTSKVSVRCRSEGDRNDFGILFHKFHAATFVLYSLHLKSANENSKASF